MVKTIWLNNNDYCGAYNLTNLRNGRFHFSEYGFFEQFVTFKLTDHQQITDQKW